MSAATLLSRAALLGGALLAPACHSGAPPSGAAPRPAHGDAAPFEIAVIGDMPYIPSPDPQGTHAGIMRQYARVLDDVRGSRAAMVVHVGDITGFHCADSVLTLRRAELDALGRPLVLTFGDNEWIDCQRNGFDPLGRLTLLRELFTQGDSSLGHPALPLARQSADPRFAEMRENVRWERGGVLFVGLHVVPLPTGYLNVPAQAREHERRTAANVAWLRESFALAAQAGRRGVAVFLQANPGWGAELQEEYVPVRDELARLAATFPGQVAVVHGDTHLCRIDRPMVDLAGRPLLGVVRAETFGNPRHHWLRMTVSPAADTIFRFAPAFVAGNVPSTCQVHGRLVSGG